MLTVWHIPQTIPGRLCLYIYLRAAIMPTVGDVEKWNRMLSIFWPPPGQTVWEVGEVPFCVTCEGNAVFLEKRGEKKKNALLPTKDIRRSGPISAGYISIHWMTQLISLLFIRVRLFKRWIVLSTGWITMQRMAYFISVILIHRIVIYPVDSVSNVLTTRASWIVIYPVDSAILSVWTTGPGCREDIIASGIDCVTTVENFYLPVINKGLVSCERVLRRGVSAVTCSSVFSSRKEKEKLVIVACAQTL